MMVYKTQPTLVAQLLRLALFKGPSRVGHKHIQFPKYCVLCFFLTLDENSNSKH
jgi:hypothetical protein